ncbi:MAG: hypothetical protein M1833_002771 [Piccolia ochrophora]|nr:MAG: hypothetical protein M1833_002771 [Piccolia ochrophora]
MPPIRPKLSITLPRNFTFHYTDGQEPKSPETVEEAPTRPPSPPRPYRLRARRRPAIPVGQSINTATASSLLQDIPIPTIETTNLHTRDFPAMNRTAPIPTPVEGFLAPIPTRRRIFASRTSSGRDVTPLPALDTERSNWGPEREISPEDSISRPLSACSISSNSSGSSSATSASIPSTGGSCTSPESDASDPFVYIRNNEKGKQLLETTALGVVSPNSRTHPLKRPQWTEEMDKHLWTTYLLYLQDPTVTPFRVNPGGVPPLGVCHRVAREAKRTWRGSRASLLTKSNSTSTLTDTHGSQVLRDVNDEAHAVRVESAASTDKDSGSVTPTGPETQKVLLKWPRSESATRRRLRGLCKRKNGPSASQRPRLQSRSPTPFQRSGPRLASPFGGFDEPRFATQDMSLSLSMSTSSTMRHDSALARLAHENVDSQHVNDEWFGQPLGHPSGRSGPPLHSGLGIDGLNTRNTFPRLGSPFAGKSRPTTLQSSHLRPPSPPRTQSDSTAMVGPTLHSPLELKAPIAFSSLKRRAVHQLEEELSPGGTDIRGSIFQDLFGAPADSSHRRVRSRGFSLGDVSEGSRVSTLITPPTIYDPMNSSEFADVQSFDGPDQGKATPPSLFDRSQRLGSPFGGSRPMNDHLGTTGYDPSIGHADNSLPHFDPNTSIDQRLQSFDRNTFEK